MCVSFYPSQSYSSSSKCTESHSGCLNPEVKGLKAFSAIKRARLIPRAIFSTHTRYVHVHAWRTNNHYFWPPVLISSSRLSDSLPCAALLKMEPGTSARMTQPLSLLCACHCDASSIHGSNFEPYCHIRLATTCADMPPPCQSKLRNCGRLQNASKWRVLIRQRCPSLGGDETRAPSIHPSQFVTSAPAFVPNMAGHDLHLPQTGPCRGPLSRLPRPGCTQFPHSLYGQPTLANALILIGIRTETAEGERELMKGTGHIFCPRAFFVSVPGRETGYTVFCQRPVSGNYGLHCWLRGLRSCLLT